MMGLSLWQRIRIGVAKTLDMPPDSSFIVVLNGKTYRVSNKRK